MARRIITPRKNDDFFCFCPCFRRKVDVDEKDRGLTGVNAGFVTFVLNDRC